MACYFSLPLIMVPKSDSPGCFVTDGAEAAVANLRLKKILKPPGSKYVVAGLPIETY